MKNQYSFFALLLGLSLTSQSTWAQNAPMTVNPNAQRDIQLVIDYVNAVTVTGDQEKARALVSPSYMAHGPGGADSATIEQTLKNYQQGQKFQINRKNEFSAQSFRIPSGAMQGDWVSLWGYYTYTDTHTPAGQTVSFPYQYTAKVDKGKIVRDRLYFDELSVLKQFGFKLIPPGAPTK